MKETLYDPKLNWSRYAVARRLAQLLAIPQPSSKEMK